MQSDISSSLPSHVRGSQNPIVDEHGSASPNSAAGVHGNRGGIIEARNFPARPSGSKTEESPTPNEPPPMDFVGLQSQMAALYVATQLKKSTAVTEADAAVTPGMVEFIAEKLQPKLEYAAQLEQKVEDLTADLHADLTEQGYVDQDGEVDMEGARRDADSPSGGHDEVRQLLGDYDAAVRKLNPVRQLRLQSEARVGELTAELHAELTELGYVDVKGDVDMDRARRGARSPFSQHDAVRKLLRKYDADVAIAQTSRERAATIPLNFSDGLDQGPDPMRGDGRSHTFPPLGRSDSPRLFDYDGAAPTAGGPTGPAHWWK
ncbi:MAG: hypothetical protein ABW032_12410 [Burkholderiaceae bacterium]